MASLGRLRPTDLVWKIGTPNWREARTVQGLFSVHNPTTPARPASVPKQTGTGTVVLTRKPKVNAFLYSVRVMVDGNHVGDIRGDSWLLILLFPLSMLYVLFLAPRKTLSFDLPVGNHTIELAGAGLKRSSTMTVAANQTSRFVIYFSEWGTLGGGLKIEGDGLAAGTSMQPMPVASMQARAPTPSQPASVATSASSKRPVLIAAAATGVCFFLCCGGMGFMFVIGSAEVEKARTALSEADVLWQSGRKSEALTKYRTVLGSAIVDQQNGPRSFGRVIESDIQAGDLASAERLIADAQGRGITPDVNSAKGKEMLARQKELVTKQKELLAKQQAEAEAAKKRAKSVAAGDIESMPDDEFWWAEMIHREYGTNAFAANQKYKGKRIAVAGTVFKVKDDGWNGTQIILKGDRYDDIVYCTLSKASKKSEQLGSLGNGTFVKIIGQCDGNGIGGPVELSDCKFTIADYLKFTGFRKQ
jgi:hypothetical protein